VNDPSQPLHNAKHELYALARAAGKTGAEAYREAGYSDDKTGANAGKLTKNHLIMARMDWLKRQTATARVLTQSRKREICADIAEDPNARHGDRIAAIKADNEMAGDNADPTLVITITKAWS
jgi:hypothetical protein